MGATCTMVIRNFKTTSVELTLSIKNKLRVICTEACNNINCPIIVLLTLHTKVIQVRTKTTAKCPYFRHWERERSP